MQKALEDTKKKIINKIVNLDENHKEYKDDVLEFTQELISVKIALAICDEVGVRNKCQKP